MRFHILGMAHLPVLASISPCAYTQKVRNLCKILHGILGHEVFYYGVAGSEVDCTEFIPVVSEETWRKEFGGYDWSKSQFKTGEGVGPAWEELRKNSAREIRARMQVRDFVLCIQGWWHQPVIAELTEKEIIACEPGIGYTGVFSRFRCYESYAWKHFLYGQQMKGCGCERAYDVVIPNYYDPQEFICENVQKKDYALFMARLNGDKGILEAALATQRAGVPLWVAGQDGGHAVAQQVKDMPHVKYLGVLCGAEKIRILSEARCLLAPVTYIEPFGGVAVEAMLCGTPAITSDAGAYTETVQHGVTGYRCSTLSEYAQGIRDAAGLSSEACKRWALDRYSIHAVAPKYERWFKNLSTLWESGWYA